MLSDLLQASRVIKVASGSCLMRPVSQRSDGLENICADPKTERGALIRPAYMDLDVQVLPTTPDDLVKSSNNKPGIVALAMNEVDDCKSGKTLKGIPFIVPGARFNEVCIRVSVCFYTR